MQPQPSSPSKDVVPRTAPPPIRDRSRIFLAPPRRIALDTRSSSRLDPPREGERAGEAVLRRAAGVAARRRLLAPATEAPGLADVRRRLARHGASAELADAVLAEVARSGLSGAYALDAAARALGRLFPVQPSPRRGGATRILAFAGPTGAGKTTTVGKLARKLAEGGRRTLVASLDAASVAALETDVAAARREADADRLEVELRPVRGAGDLAEACRPGSPVEVVLLDAPGLSPRDGRGLAALARELDAAQALAPLDRHLVLPATASPAALELALASFGRLRPTAIVATKLDETDAPAPLLEIARREGLALGFLCDGRDARGHIARPRPDHFADLCLRGRLA